VEEMKESLTQRAYLNWQKYWVEEPWGPFRENLHAAIIAREVRRPNMRKGTRTKLDDFMVVNPEARRKAASANMIDFLKLVSKREHRHQ
jgi:hypothetical protein